MLSNMTGATAPACAPATDTDVRAGKYLIFQLRNEEFGVSVLKVREIITLQEITPVPQTAPHMRGVVNVRGQVIPVIDLRVKFGIAAEQDTERTCIVVIRTHTGDGELLIGVIVDAVVEVLNLGAGDIEDPPDFGEGAPPDMLLGMAKAKGKVKILLDMDQVLGCGDLHGLNALLPSAQPPHGNQQEFQEL